MRNSCKIKIRDYNLSVIYEAAPSRFRGNHLEPADPDTIEIMQVDDLDGGDIITATLPQNVMDYVEQICYTHYLESR